MSETTNDSLTKIPTSACSKEHFLSRRRCGGVARLCLHILGHEWWKHMSLGRALSDTARQPLLPLRSARQLVMLIEPLGQGC